MKALFATAALALTGTAALAQTPATTTVYVFTIPAANPGGPLVAAQQFATMQDCQALGMGMGMGTSGYRCVAVKVVAR